MNDITTIKDLVQTGMYFTTGFLDHVKIPEIFGEPTSKVSSALSPTVRKDVLYYKFNNSDGQMIEAIATFYPGDTGSFVQDTDVPFLMFTRDSKALEVFIEDVNSSYPGHTIFDMNNALGLYSIAIVNDDVLKWVSTMLTV